MGIMLNFPPPESGIHHQEPNVAAYAEDKEIGKGTVYITESVFCFIKTNGEGFSIQYPSICAHAVSKDLSYFSQECVLLLINGRLTMDEASEVSEECELVRCLSELKLEEGDGMEAAPPLHLRFVPENKNMLEVMFRALSDCQALNPDPEEMSDDGDGDLGYPMFNIQNGRVDDDEDEEEGDYDLDDEDQFEDAED